MRKILFLLVFICFSIVIALIFEKEGEFKSKVDLNGNSYMDDVNIVQRRGGIVKWTLASQKAVFLNDNDVQLMGLTITFPEKELTLHSDGGVYDIEKRNLKINGRIKASTKDYDIVTDKLFWDATRNVLLSDQRVQIIGKKFYVEGDGLDSSNGRSTLNKNVKAIFYYERK